MNRPTSTRRIPPILSASLLAALLAPSALADFIPTTAGPHDYNTTTNWDSGTINGTWSRTLTGAQVATFAADTTLSTGWTFNFGSSNNLVLRSDAIADRTVTLGGDVSMDAVTDGRITTIGSSTAGQALNVALGANRTFTVAGTDTLRFANSISGSGFGITKEGTGTLGLGGLGSGGAGFSGNTFTGSVEVNAGTLRLTGAGSTLTYADAINLDSGTTLALVGNATSDASTKQINTGTISLAGTVNLAISGSTSTRTARLGGALSFGNNAALVASYSTQAATTFNAAAGATLNGANSITVINSAGTTTNSLKLGAISEGTAGSSLTISTPTELAVTLTAANTYTGATTINSGTLALASTGSIASASALTITDGATFDVSAKTAYALGTGDTTVGIGATTGGLFNAGTAALTFGNALTLNFTTTLPAGSYNLFDFGSQTGTFSAITLTGSIGGSLFLTSTDTWTGSAGGYDFTFSELDGVLSAVSAIPEPSTSAALLGACAIVTTAWIRRRRQAHG